jgi:hypothetical protein
MPGGSGDYRQCLVKDLDDGGRLGQSRQAAEGLAVTAHRDMW